jgi:hypothetical protein
VLYPGVEDIERAAVVDVRAGSDVTDINLTLVRPSFYRIRGRVLDSRTNLPPQATNVWVSTQLAGGGSSYNYSVAVTGDFEIADLMPATYEITARLNRSDGNSDRVSTIVVVGNSDVEDVLLKVGNPPVDPQQISGRIALEGPLPAGSTLRSIGVRVKLLARIDNSVAALLSASGGSGADAPARDDGTFVLEDVPEGDFRVGIDWIPPGFYLKEARLGVLTDSRRIGPLSMTTRRDGRFLFKDLDAGAYQLTLASNGYVKRASPASGSR